MPDVLSAEEVELALADLPGWTLAESGDAITRSVKAATFADGIALVQRAAEVAEARNHHPDIDIRWTTITFTLSTHSAGGVTAADLDLARRLDAIS